MKQLKTSQNEYIIIQKQVREHQDQIERLKKNKEQVKRINEKLIVGFYLFIFKKRMTLKKLKTI